MTFFLIFLLSIFFFLSPIYSMEEEAIFNDYGIGLTLDEAHLRDKITKSIMANREGLKEEFAQIIATTFFIREENLKDAELITNLLKKIRKKYPNPAIYDMCQSQIRKINQILERNNGSKVKDI